MIYNRKKFFDAVRKSFGPLKQSQVDGFGYLLSAWEHEYPKGDVRYLAYALATAWHETAYTMEPIEERGRGKGRKYGPTGYWGRGYVQLTWDYNYLKASQRLKALYGITVDLVKNPEKALEPSLAVLIMFAGMIEGWFTGKKLSDYFNASKDDPVNARRIINGTDKADKIAGHYEAFLSALKGALEEPKPLGASQEATEAKEPLPGPTPAEGSLKAAPESPEEVGKSAIITLDGPKAIPKGEPNLLVSILSVIRYWLTNK